MDCKLPPPLVRGGTLLLTPMPQASSKVIAGCFALAAFAVSLMAGVWGGDPAFTVLTRSLIIMMVCYPIGYIVGLICAQVIERHVKDYVEANPAPDSTDGDEVNYTPTPPSSGGSVDQIDGEEVLTV